MNKNEESLRRVGIVPEPPEATIERLIKERDIHKQEMLDISEEFAQFKEAANVEGFRDALNEAISIAENLSKVINKLQLKQKERQKTHQTKEYKKLRTEIKKLQCENEDLRKKLKDFPSPID